jgi:predicted RNA-binding protein with PIN domain
MPKPLNYLLVDGYNIVFAWEELAKLAKESLNNARLRLCDILCDYQGYTNLVIIVVFDAHLVDGNMGSISEYNNITVVFTKEAETADHYIEQTTRVLSRRYRVTVATSDVLEQVIIISQGARRMSAEGLLLDIEDVKKKQFEAYEKTRVQEVKNNPLSGLLDKETLAKLEAMRFGSNRKKKEK